MTQQKIFCIGFQKTGTSSLGQALTILGFKVQGPAHTRNPLIKDKLVELSLPLIEHSDAFQDNPWPILYKILDDTYPGSRFILTERDPEGWIKSVLHHFGKKSTPMRELIYGVGCPEENEDVYIKRFIDHNMDVREYFKDRADDLLILNLKHNNSWNLLCKFLNKPIPSCPFPHANVGKTRKSDKNPRWKTWLRKLRGKPYK